MKTSIDNLLKNQNLAVLATRGERYPYNTLVGFACTDDLHTILLATIRDTRKYRNMILNPTVSLLVDSRTNTTEDFKEAEALTVLGSAREVSGRARKRYTELYLKRHPHLEDFINDPNTALMEITAHRYIMVRRFQEVMEIEVR